MENQLVIHGEPPPWRKSIKFVGPRLDFEGSLYDDYDLIEPPINFNLDDEVAQRTEQLMRDMYDKTVALLRQHHAALLKIVKVCWLIKLLIGKISFSLPVQVPSSIILFNYNRLCSLPKHIGSKNNLYYIHCSTPVIFSLSLTECMVFHKFLPKSDLLPFNIFDL